MKTVSDIIDAFGGASVFSRIIGKSQSTASEMKRREVIPLRYWSIIIRSGKKRGIVLTNDILARAHAPDSGGAKFRRRK